MTDRSSQNLTNLIDEKFIKAFDHRNEKQNEKDKKKVSRNFELKLKVSNQERVRRLSSLARIVVETSSEKEICCCFYVDKEKKFWYFTNLSGKLNENAYEEFQSKIKDNTVNIQQYLLEENRKEFLRQAFLYGGKVYRKVERSTKRDVKEIISKLGSTNLSQQQKKDKEILSLVYNDFYEHSLSWKNSEQDIVKHFQNIKNKIRSYLEELSLVKKEEKIIEAATLVVPVCTYIEDYFNIYHIHKEKDFVRAFRERLVRRAQSDQSWAAAGFHCEQRALVYISSMVNNTVSQQVFDELKRAVNAGDFVVSKICCGYCFSVFRSFGKVCAQNNAFFSLGNSSSFFPGWKSPSFNKGHFFEELKKEVESYLERVAKIQQITEYPQLENSQTGELFNQIEFSEFF